MAKRFVQQNYSVPKMPYGAGKQFAVNYASVPQLPIPVTPWSKVK